MWKEIIEFHGQGSRMVFLVTLQPHYNTWVVYNTLYSLITGLRLDSYCLPLFFFCLLLLCFASLQDPHYNTIVL